MLQFLLQANAGAKAGPMETLMSFLPMVLILAALYFVMIRPQRHKEIQLREMRSNLEVGDEIITNGGIIGRVVVIRDDNVVIETGSDRSKIRIARWAIQTNSTAVERAGQSKKPGRFGKSDQSEQIDK